MNCPHCHLANTNERVKKTMLGYRKFYCKNCKHLFNERTGTPFNFLAYPTDIVMMVVFYRLLYKLSLRDLAEMFLLRGFQFTHEAVREWSDRFAPLMSDYLRNRRRCQNSRNWHVDETYLKIEGRWHYLYQCIDREGNLVDVMLSKNRDMASAKKFFQQASISNSMSATIKSNDRWA